MSLPYQAHSDTSRAAAIEIESAAETLRGSLYRCLLDRPTHGMTDEEQQKALRMNPSTQRPRRVELVEMGLVCDSGKRRRTSSGRMAVVWIATDPKSEPEQLNLL